MDRPLVPIEKASIFCEGLDHPEGVAVHPDGSVWAGGEGGQIYRVSGDGQEVTEVANTGGFILGLAFSPNREWLLACDLGNKCLWRLDLDTFTLSAFARSAGGHGQFKIPNYACFARDGTLYVSDSGTFGEVDGCILRFGPEHDGRGNVWHAGPFNFANGLALSPSEDALYVVCSFSPSVERIELLPDGSPGKRSTFLDLPKTVPDGLAFDTAGNLYVTCYAPNRIYRVDPDGRVDLLLDDWEAHTLSNPTNIAFGGPHFDQLFASNLGRWHLTRIDLGVSGAPLPCHNENTPAPSSRDTIRVAGQDSWRIATSQIEAFLTRQGGHLGPISFHVGDRTLTPYALAPWAHEDLGDDLPAVLKVLRGDFFCLPFGANEYPYLDERHPPHGETANSRWSLESIHHHDGSATLHAFLETTVRPGRVDKYITLKDGHHAIYSRHFVSGMAGAMSLGHHAMLKFPDAPGSGIITTSRFVYAQTSS